MIIYLFIFDICDLPNEFKHGFRYQKLPEVVIHVQAINCIVRPFVHNELYKIASKSRGIIRIVHRTCENTEPIYYTSNINDLIC